ncbi:hypothetical protein GJ744_011885 [Endocarpon pusillum]|uniref:Uncharacterized protein n=1 Tax=Endocarpon pusillum TaxID=364733 RepID=A0A8H7AEG6_9EURO|nr:hypothetical protein GJ744_011885 [Endocarpon pusillum]
MLNRSIFVNLYLQARGIAITERNIRAEWKRAGIWPLNKQKLLENPEVVNFGRTTPEYQPAPVKEGPNRLLGTPKKPEEYQELGAKIKAKVTPRTRRAVRKLVHAALQERTGTQALRTELQGYRKEALDDEVIKRSKRLQKDAVQTLVGPRTGQGGSRGQKTF